MKDPIAKLVPLLARGLAPSAAVASGLLSPIALGASGDFDPSFADVGRLGPLTELPGPAWSLQVPDDDDGVIFAGGNFDDGCGDSWYCYYDFDASGFLGRLSDTGSIEQTTAGLEDIEVLDVALQPDGKAIAVGRTEVQDERTALTAFRLERDGSLDLTFGGAGIVQFPADNGGARHNGSSVALDPDGRIVIAGSRDGMLVVTRLMPDGSLDSTFGDAGVFVGPANEAVDARTRIVRTALGSYRIAANLRDFRSFSRADSPCMVVGLTANGALDGTFGSMGIARLDATAGELATCSAMSAQPDGKLLLAGSDNSRGFATRLLASGTPDPSFAGSAIADAMQDATALAIDDDGSVIVAGRGLEGVNAALVMRLQANGELDALFGNAGSTWIDLPSAHGATPSVHDIRVLPNGNVLLAGGDLATRPARPFLVRLVGDGGGDGPGVLGVSRTLLAAKEQDQRAVLAVRRMGGAAGSVSVGYRTRPTASWPLAVSGQDYTAVSGRLEWSDGDSTDKEIVIPIASNGSVEGHEYFQVALSGVQGGAGLGTRDANVQIAADGEPGGQLFVSANVPSVGELAGTVQLSVYRQFYSTGAVSVTVTPIAGTATAGADFAGSPVTVSWGDGDFSSKTVTFTILDDRSDEDVYETFTVALSNPTGGAILGPDPIAQIVIVDNEGVSGSAAGGGRLGYLSVLFLGVVGFLRFASRRRPASQERVSSISS